MTYSITTTKSHKSFRIFVSEKKAADDDDVFVVSDGETMEGKSL